MDKNLEMIGYPTLVPFGRPQGPMSKDEISNLLAFSHSQSPEKEKHMMSRNDRYTNEGNSMRGAMNYPPQMLPPAMPNMPMTPSMQMAPSPMMQPTPPHMAPGIMPPMQMPNPMHQMNPFMMNPMMFGNMMKQSPPLPKLEQPSKTVSLQCPIPDCKTVWNKTKSLYRHLREDHNTDFKCPHCDKQSTCMSNFVCHVRLHTNEKPWVCPIPGCEYRGRTKNHSKSHVIQNHGIKYFHQHENFFLQDRSKKPSSLEHNPFTIPKSLFKRSSAMKKSFQLSGASYMHTSFSPSPARFPSPPEHKVVPPGMKF